MLYRKLGGFRVRPLLHAGQGRGGRPGHGAGRAGLHPLRPAGWASGVAGQP